MDKSRMLLLNEIDIEEWCEIAEDREDYNFKNEDE